MRPALLAALLVCSLPVVARADTIETFGVNSTAGTAHYSVTGTLTFDLTTATFTGSNLVTSFGAISGAPTQVGTNTGSVYAGFGTFGSIDYVVFNIPGSTLNSYAGGLLCSAANSCPDGQSYLISGYAGYEFESGSLTLLSSVSQTPEPSSLALLGTGLLGVIGAARRRFA